MSKPQSNRKTAAKREVTRPAPQKSKPRARRTPAGGEAKRTSAGGEAKRTSARGEAKRTSARGGATRSTAPGEAKRTSATRSTARGGAKRTSAKRSTALAPVGGVRSQPLLAVRDVQASSHWYATLLDLERTSVTMRSNHPHLYDRLLADGALVLQLHAWDEEEHPNLVNPAEARPGHGVLVWFEVDDFDAAVERAKTLDAEMLLAPHVNERPQHREMWLADPDGYVVVIASPDGEAK